MMNALGDELLAQTVGAVVTRDSKTGRMTALAYNYPPEMKVSLPVTETLAEADAIDANGSSRAMEMHLSGLMPGAAFEIETLDREHGDAVAAWEKMGRPDPPTPVQTKALRSAARATRREIVRADSGGRLDLKRPIEAWSLVLVRQL
jgi:xylan 1,4-beta-xylosidase